VTHASVHEEVNLEDETGIRDHFFNRLFGRRRVQGKFPIPRVVKRAPNGSNACPKRPVDVELHLLVDGKVLEDLPHSDPAVG
jgi:hypothetical protein